MNLTRGGTAFAVGAVSGAAETKLQPVSLGGQAVTWGLLLEMAALLGGVGLQFMSPYTFPEVADGAVDGSLALLGRRAGAEVTKQVAPMASGAWRVGGCTSAPQLAAGYAARGQIGSVGRTPSYKLT